MPRSPGTDFSDDTIARVVAAAGQVPASDRIAVLDALTRVDIPADRWNIAAPLAAGLVGEFVASKRPLPRWADVLVRVPLPRARAQLEWFAGNSGRRNAVDLEIALQRVRPSGPPLPYFDRPLAVHVEPELLRELSRKWNIRPWDGIHVDLDGEDLLDADSLTPEWAAMIFENAVAQFYVLARDTGLPAEALRSALADLVAALPGPLPLDAAALLGPPDVAELVPRPLLSWAVGQVGGNQALQVLLEDFAATDVANRPVFARWIGDVCLTMDVATPPQPGKPVVEGLTVRSQAELPIREATISTVPAQRSLVLALQGEQVSGSSIVAGTQADLLMIEAVDVEGVLQEIDNDAIETAREADLDMLLLATARGGVSLTGTQFAKARFRSGRLAEPVRFRVQASGSGSECSASVHIEFLVRGERVHEAEVALQVVPSAVRPDDVAIRPLAAALDAKQLLECGLAAAAPPRQQILLSLSMSGGCLRISLADLRDGVSVFSGEYPSDDLDHARLETLRREIDTELLSCYRNDDVWGIFDGQAAGPLAQDEVDAALHHATDTIACAGSLLNEALRTNLRISEAIQYVEVNAGQDAVLSITTDNIFFPWEILYPIHRARNMPRAVREANPLNPGMFWGVRFAIETERRGTGPGHELRKRYLACAPKVAVNLNPDIKVSPAPANQRQPFAVHRDWAEELERSGMLDSLRSSCGDMRGMLQDGDGEPTVIYVYCHGTSPNPQAGTGEELVLDQQCRLVPREVHGGPTYKNAPIIFLNSCRAGASSALAFSTFLSEFRARGALGMIGTSYAVPITYGAHFARHVVACCVEPKGALAARLLALRRERLLERNDPVPLFYTLQCHLH